MSRTKIITILSLILLISVGGVSLGIAKYKSNTPEVSIIKEKNSDLKEALKKEKENNINLDKEEKNKINISSDNSFKEKDISSESDTLDEKNKTSISFDNSFKGKDISSESDTLDEKNKTHISSDNPSEIEDINNTVYKENKEIILENIGTKPGNYNTDNSNPPPSFNSRLLKGAKYKLPVEQKLQQVWYYCAPTTVSMMLSSRGIDVDQYQLAKEMGTYEPYGTHNVDAIRILNKHMFGTEYPTEKGGYRLETVTQVDEATLTLFKQRVMKNIQDGYPMYYTFDVSKIYPGLQGEHNVIGNGYIATPDGNDIAYIYYIDPSPNVQDPVYGSLKILTPEELLTAMLTCGEPNYAW